MPANAGFTGATDASAPGQRVPGRARSGWQWSILAAIALLGAALRFAAMEATFPVKPIGDESYYIGVATMIARGEGHVAMGGTERAAWPPANAYLLSHFIDPESSYKGRFITRLANIDRADIPDRGRRLLRPLVRVQVLLSSLLVVLTALLARALFDDRTMLVAGALAALYPTFIAYGHYLFAENLFAVLLAAALLGVVRVQARPQAPVAALAGLLFGAATLTRELALPLAGVAALWWVWSAEPLGRREAVANGALMLGCTVLVILPWTWRNHAVLGHTVPVSTVGWMAVREGNILRGIDWRRPDRAALDDFRNRYLSHPGEVERMRLARREALAIIRAEQPGWIGKKLVRNTPLLFNPDSFLFKKISRGAYGDLPIGAVRFLLVVSVLFYVAVATLAVLGVAFASGAGRSALPILVVGTTFAVHVVANASSRYRFPLMPLLVVYASHALVARRPWRYLSRGRAVVSVAILAIFFLGCVPHFWFDFASLWTRGTYVDPSRP